MTPLPQSQWSRDWHETQAAHRAHLTRIVFWTLLAFVLLLLAAAMDI